MYCEIPDFVRCRFCLPLRRGVLTFGYIRILFCAFMIGMYSARLHQKITTSELLIYNGTTSIDVPAEVCIALYCMEAVLSTVLVYGAHLKNVLCLKVFFYYAISTAVAALLLQVVEFITPHRPSREMIVDVLVLAFTGLCIEIYLIVVTRSLLRKLQTSGTQVYENQLHLVVSGDRRAQNGVYTDCTVLPSDV